MTDFWKEQLQKMLVGEEDSKSILRDFAAYMHLVIEKLGEGGGGWLER